MQKLIDKAERQLIGMAIYDSQTTLSATANYITPQHFSNARHRKIWTTIADLYHANLPIDPEGLQGVAQPDEVIKLVDDAPHVRYISGIIDVLINRNNQQHLIQLLTDHGETADGIAIALSIFKKSVPDSTWRTITRQADATLSPQLVSDWLQTADPPIKQIIPGLFDAGDRVSIVGQSKARKSFFVLQLAISIAAGRDFLYFADPNTNLPPPKRKTLLFNGEISANNYRRRVRAMAHNMGIAADELDHLHVINGTDVSGQQTYSTILAVAKETEAEVVIVDPAYLLIGDEIDQREVKEAIENMRQFAVENIALINVFHAAKGLIGDRQIVDRISGSGIFARDFTSMISLVEHAREEDHVVIKTVTRNYPPQDAGVIFFENGTFGIAEDVVAEEKNSKNTRNYAKKEVTDYDILTCFSGGRMNYSDTLEAVKTRLAVGNNRAKEIIADALIKGLINREKEGRSTFYTAIK